MNLSTALDQGPVTVRCGQCWINRERASVENKGAQQVMYIGELRRNMAGVVIFTEARRVSADAHDELRYPTQQRPMNPDPSPEEWLYVTNQRNRGIPGFDPGLVATDRYDYSKSRPRRLIEHTTHGGITAKCRRGHHLYLSSDSLDRMMTAPLPEPRTILLLPADSQAPLPITDSYKQTQGCT